MDVHAGISVAATSVVVEGPLLSAVVLAPLIGAVLTYFVGRLRPSVAGWIATLAAAISAVFAAFLVRIVAGGAVVQQQVWHWFSVGNVPLEMSLRLDQLSAVMVLFVTGIGTLIHLYSVDYMKEDEARPRFFAYLNLFLFSMLLLILGGNLLVLFIGWEGVGLCSYLLIGFWHKNEAYARAGRKAFVVNRIGDAGVLIAAFLLIQHLGTVDFTLINERTSQLSPLVASLIAGGLFLGATGKSAQLPLFVWLPDAMAGPTPVSALIHAATMVTAGVYLMARLHPVFVAAPDVMTVAVVIAALTAFVAASIALVQNDIKKVLAYSTVSQLGFMFIAAASGAFWVALFHVVTHAFFKACLFLGAGSVIHGCHHEQDMRRMGGLWRLMPITFVTYAIATLAIAGVYPFAGYHSKHAILVALEGASFGALQPWLMGLVKVTALLTAFYMTRSLVLTFLGSYRGHAHPHESPLLMVLPLIVLGALSVVGGVYLESVLPQFVAPVLPTPDPLHVTTMAEGLAGSLVGILGMVAALVVYLVAPKVATIASSRSGPLGALLRGKWFIDEIYAACIVRPLEQGGKLLWKIVDQGLIDGTVNGSAASVDATGRIFGVVQSGQVRWYAFVVFGGTTLLLLVWFHGG